MATRGGCQRVFGLTLATLVVLALTGCSPLFGSSDPPSPTPTPTPDTTSTTTPPPRPSSSELAQSVVQVVQLDEQGEEVCSYGSGTLLDSTGTILTNFHVVRSDECDEYSTIGIALTNSVDEPPTLRYLADAYAFDAGLDLAVLKISSTLGGGSVTTTFPFVKMGNSDAVQLGDEIDILGYPAIGGQTITYTEGRISGFALSPDVDGRAWLKTDGTITGGNSGGLGADVEGRIVGVPTRAASGDTERVADCRVIQDTDGDGDTDEEDTCIPIGGFLNSLRPINLARPLIEEAARGRAIAVDDLVPPARAVAHDPVISAVRFASDVDASDEPVDEVVTLPTGSDRICAFLDYAGLADGTAWDAVWKRDGDVDQDMSFTGQTWAYGESGTTWLCTGVRDDTPITDGLWELSVYLDGSEEPSESRSIYVGDAHLPVEVTVTNSQEESVCFLYLSPDLASTWEDDRLGRDESLAPGASLILDLPAGQYDLLARGCDESRTELVELEGIEIVADQILELR
jgi:S1-C subfamily serine protease